MTFHIRDATPLDAGTTGEILHQFNCATSWLPDLHSGAEAISFCGTMIDKGWMRVATTESVVVGFCACDGQEIYALYVAENHRGLGVGQQLLHDATSGVPEIQLWTFAANAQARRFYERNGFVCTRKGDGSANEEGLPDVLYQWSGKADTKQRVTQ